MYLHRYVEVEDFEHMHPVHPGQHDRRRGPLGANIAPVENGNI
jgi:hypothetical protein